MSEPWTPGYTAAVLGGMSADQLARVTPADFRRWPSRRPLPDKTGRDLIAQERAKRVNQPISPCDA